MRIFRKTLLFSYVGFSSVVFVVNLSAQDTTATAPAIIPAKTEAVSDSSVHPSQKNPIWHSEVAKTATWLKEDATDLVSFFPNIIPLDYGSPGQFSPLVFRGVTPQGGGVIFDELLLAEPILGHINTSAIPINLVEETNFFDATSWGPFGAQFVAGAFQIIPYRFEGRRPYSKVIFRAGDWAYSDMGIVFGLPIMKSTSLTLSGNRQEIDGFQANRNHRGSHIFARLSHQPNSQFELTFSSLINNHEAEVPAPLFPDFAPFTANQRREESRLDQNLSFRLGNLFEQNRELNGAIFFSKNRLKSFQDSLRFNNRNITYGAALDQKINVGNHRFAFGGEFRVDDLSSGELGNRSDRFGYAFLRDEYRLLSRVAIGLQGRLEKHNGYDMAFMPSAHLIYDFSQTSEVKIGIQRSRRYPSFAERFWPTTTYLGNPQLAAEQSTVLELGLDWPKESDVSFQASIFSNFFADWIGNVTTDTLFFGPQNLGERTIAGVDFKLLWNYASGGQMGLIGSLLKVDEADFEKQLQVPEVSLYSYVEYGRHFFDRYVYATLRLIGRFYGARYGFDYSGNVPLPEITQLEPDAVFDGQINLEFSDATLQFSMENLLDRRYQLVPGFFMPPRTLRFGIGWEFLD